jgi:large subunit ribosomal protein L10
MSTQRKTETIPEWKREEVDDIVSFIETYDSIGVVDITGIPSRQLQEMRSDLYGTAALRVSRNTLLVRALAEVADRQETGDLADLTAEVTGQVGLIGTSDNPFGLYQQLEASKTSAPINAGEVAPNDIVVPEGDTGVDPGPFVGELQSVGANARIDQGSITVMEDSTVLEAGEEVSSDLANVLGELGIEPKEVGLDLRSVFADGVLFEPADLELDTESYREDVATAAGRAQNLALNASIPTASTLPSLLSQATGDAKSLGLQAAIEDPDVVPDLIATADRQLRALAAQIDDEEALPEELQDVDAPADQTPEESTDEETEAPEETDDTTSEPEADETDDTDDDEDGGDALGEMFG